MQTLVFNTYQDFLKREDKSVNGVTPEFAKANPNYEKDNETNKGCWNCKICEHCLFCTCCINLKYSIGCSNILDPENYKGGKVDLCCKSCDPSLCFQSGGFDWRNLILVVIDIILVIGLALFVVFAVFR
jgi:hypothetical protein